MGNKKELIKGWIKFFTKDKFQWYLTIMAIVTILRWVGFISPPGFESIVKYVSVSLFVAEGANQLTNFRNFEGDG